MKPQQNHYYLYEVTETNNQSLRAAPFVGDNVIEKHVCNDADSSLTILRTCPWLYLNVSISHDSSDTRLLSLTKGVYNNVLANSELAVS